MHIYIHICAHKYIYKYICIHISKYKLICVYTYYIYIHMHTYIYIYIYNIYIYIYIYETQYHGYRYEWTKTVLNTLILYLMNKKNKLYGIQIFKNFRYINFFDILNFVVIVNFLLHFCIFFWFILFSLFFSIPHPPVFFCVFFLTFGKYLNTFKYLSPKSQTFFFKVCTDSIVLFTL